ncbi:unnamed protein product, partial [Ectocarpus fasciculatus]
SNSADWDGGAIYAYDSTVSWDGDGTQFSSNFADVSGGAIYVMSFSELPHVTDAVFINNRAGNGGAVYIYAGGEFQDEPTTTISGCNFSDNVADDAGGAV